MVIVVVHSQNDVALEKCRSDAICFFFQSTYIRRWLYKAHLHIFVHEWESASLYALYMCDWRWMWEKWKYKNEAKRSKIIRALDSMSYCYYSWLLLCTSRFVKILKQIVQKMRYQSSRYAIACACMSDTPCVRAHTHKRLQNCFTWANTTTAKWAQG